MGVISLEGNAGGLVVGAVLSKGSLALIMSEGDVGDISAGAVLSKGSSSSLSEGLWLVSE